MLGKSTDTCFVYVIECSCNKKRYVGVTKHIENRRLAHLYALRSGRHCNKALQSDFNSYGENNFSFSVIGTTTVKDRSQSEKRWIEKYKSHLEEYGYNFHDQKFYPRIKSRLRKEE